MSSNLLSSLHTSLLPITEIGHLAHRLTQAIDLAVPVAPTAIIPVSTLREIADHNHLSEKLERYLHHLHYDDPNQVDIALKSIKQAIRHQEMPENVRHHLTQVYHHQLSQEWVSVTASFCDEIRTELLTHRNIKGEVNLHESLLTLWAEAVTFKARQIELFPAAFVIQAQPQPTASGVLYSAHPANGNKTRQSIESVWGVFNETLHLEKDVFEVDARTHQLVKALTGSQREYLVRALDQDVPQRVPEDKQGQPSLSPSQVRQLSEWASKLKHHFLTHLKLEWQLIRGRLCVTQITPFILSTTESTHRHEVIVIGDSFIGGFIQGQCVVQPSANQRFSAGEILVVDRLTKVHQGLIRQAAAIVTEETISDSLLTQLINYYHIPTLINAKHATRRLRAGQDVIVDASGGKVISSTTAPHVLKTATKVYSLVTNPYSPREAYADGHYFKSDYTFLHPQLSPQAVIISSQAKLLKETLSKRLATLTDQPLWYRFSNFHSGQLAPKAQALEQPEPNPYFGRRGALFHLADPALLHFELDVLKKMLPSVTKPIKLVLPFVRTPAEKELLIYQIQSRLGDQFSHVEIWLELANLEMLMNLNHYLTTPIHGVIIPLPHLHALWLGLDPENPSLLKHYSQSPEFLTQLLLFFKPYVTQLVVELPQLHPGMLDTIVSQSLSGIATKPSQLKMMKEQLIKLEERHVSHGRH